MSALRRASFTHVVTFISQPKSPHAIAEAARAAGLDLCIARPAFIALA
jgi:hypothetical protein